MKRLTRPGGSHGDDDEEKEKRESAEDDGDVAASVVEAELAGVHLQHVAVLPLDGRREFDVVATEVSIVGDRELVGRRAGVHHHHHGRLVLAVGRVVAVEHVVVRTVFVDVVKLTIADLVSML